MSMAPLSSNANEGLVLEYGKYRETFYDDVMIEAEKVGILSVSSAQVLTKVHLPSSSVVQTKAIRSEHQALAIM